MVVRNVSNVNDFYACLQNQMYKSSVVKFTAKWCGPCKMMKPYYEQLSYSYPSVQFLEVDVDELPDVMNWAQVRAMPTFTVFKNGAKMQEVVGVNQFALHDMIRKFSF